ncbi:MAG: glycolate oxidase iron-sulfur subunit [Verrucomicrobia bacterium]|jgi:glycolate oxidase iron-sulfur subunit|nr:MAG: glycolate oxidase iron-sulfur subunit [Verrucomicrobiota bacterium]
MAKASLRDLDYKVLQQCMHCGMCLPTCPTYISSKLERHSPRGRIALMRAVADGRFEAGQDLAREMNYCLGCLACTTACPAGVDYGTMFETARAETEANHSSGGPMRRFYRWLVLEQIFLFPRRLRLVGWLLRTYQRTGLADWVRRLKLPYLLGRKIGDLEPQAPGMESPFSDGCIAEVEVPPAGIPVRGRVGLLSGCIQSLAFGSVNRATADVLLANGWEVVTPRLQSCCGSLHAHNGAPELARRAAKALMERFELDGLDAIITNAGGCGSHLKHYAGLFAEGDLATKARAWDAKVKDIHEFLVGTGFRKPRNLAAESESVRLTYHESCHLSHGQGIRNPPREILRALPGFQLVELPESDLCCGSAGIYNILQPEESQRLLERKTGRIAGTAAELVATANPGCHLQLARGLQQRDLPVQVVQPVVLLAEAYRREVSP